MRHPVLPALTVLAALSLATACADTRSHSELMADAAADLEAIRLDTLRGGGAP